MVHSLNKLKSKLIEVSARWEIIIFNARLCEVYIVLVTVLFL
jgi:hypothetical protein